MTHRIRAVKKMHEAHVNHPVGNQMAKLHAEMMADPNAKAHAEMMGNPNAKPSEQALRKHFDELDANSNGAVTFAEFKQMHASMMGHSH